MASILCVDDDPKILEVHQAVLECNGHTVYTASGGIAGLAVARTHPLDLVILDLQLPGLSGGQIAALLKKEQPALSLALCSSCPDELPPHLKKFVDGILSKCDGPDKLLAMVQRLIQLTELRRGSNTRASVIERLRALSAAQTSSRFLHAFAQPNHLVHAVCEFCSRAAGRHSGSPDDAYSCTKMGEQARQPSKRQLVFVVDDDKMVAETTSLVLKYAGFEVLTFYDALPAAQKARLSIPDVVVTAYAMPMNGLVLTAWLRENCPCCRVVILSGDTDAVTEQGTVGLKYTLLKKPIPPEDLISAVRAC